MGVEDGVLEHAVRDLAKTAVSRREAGQVQVEQALDLAEAQHKVFPESVTEKVLELQGRGLRCPVVAVEIRVRGVR